VAGWDVSPLVTCAALLAMLQFGRAFVRLRRRGRTDHAAWDRAALFAAGIAVSVLPLASPLAGSSLSGHMLEHVLVADVGPALLVLAVRGPLLFFLLPASVVRVVHRRAGWRRACSLLLQPWLAVAVWAGAYAAWHVPGAYDLALRSEWAHTLQHLSFVLAGVLVWTQLVDPAGRRRVSAGARLGLAGAIFAFGQILCLVLLVAERPLYEAYAAQDGALRDQQLAGIVMMLEQFLVLGAFAFLLVRSCLRRPPLRTAAAM
jgi:cytochrome c oxidase assembly factor CtaG